MKMSRHFIKLDIYASFQKSVSVTGQTKEIATQSARTKHVGPVFNNNQEIALMVVWKNVKILKRNKGSLAICKIVRKSLALGQIRTPVKQRERIRHVVLENETKPEFVKMEQRMCALNLTPHKSYHVLCVIAPKCWDVGEILLHVILTLRRSLVAQVVYFKREIVMMVQQIDVHDGISSNTFVAALPIVQRNWEIGLPVVIANQLVNMMDAVTGRLVKQEHALMEHPINARLLRPKEKLTVPCQVATLQLESGMM